MKSKIRACIVYYIKVAGLIKIAPLILTQDIWKSVNIKKRLKSGFKAIGLQICPLMMGMLTRKIRVVALDDLRRTIYVAHPFERH